jgi:hypothetical protein
MPGKLPAPYDKYIGPGYDKQGTAEAIADDVADHFRPFLPGGEFTSPSF